MDCARSRDRVRARSRRLGSPPARQRLRAGRSCRAVRRREHARPHLLRVLARMVGAVALRGDLARPLAPPLILASTSPQRSAILDQLRIPFDVVPPGYVEEGDDPLDHAAGKARSVDGGERPVLGVDTVVVCDGELIGKPSGPGDAERMLEALAGVTHEVVSGLCLRTAVWEELHRETTRVTFRPLRPRELAHYL